MQHPFAIRTLACATAALALTLFTGSPADAQDTPYQAEITADSIKVRSGAGRAYYEVGQLKKGDVVTVENELFGWYQISPPQGVFSFVERKNVDAKGNGKQGVVNTDRTQVNAAHASKGPADSYRSQGDLNAGDAVKIVGIVDNAYKIVPPDSASVFLPPNSLKVKTEAAPPAEPVKPAPAQPAEPMRPDVTLPENTDRVVENTEPAPAVIEPAPITPTPVVVNPPAPKPDPKPVVATTDLKPRAERSEAPDQPLATAPAADNEVILTTDAQNPKLLAVEQAMLPLFELPVDEQPIAKMVKGYADAAAVDGLSSGDLRIIQDRLTTLERNRDLAAALKQPEATSDTEIATATVAPVETVTITTTEPGEVEPAPVAMAAEPFDATATDTLKPRAERGSASEAPDQPTATVTVAPQPAPVIRSTPTPLPAIGSGYDAVGFLTASTVHNGSNQPSLMRLVDPTARRTIAYIEPGDIDTVQMLGKLVGVTGVTTKDPTMRLKLIQVAQIEILGPSN